MPPAKPPSPPRDPAPLSASHTHTAAAPNMAAAAGLRPFPPPSGNIRAARQSQFPPVPETPAPHHHLRAPHGNTRLDSPSLTIACSRLLPEISETAGAAPFTVGHFRLLPEKPEVQLQGSDRTFPDDRPRVPEG